MHFIEHHNLTARTASSSQHERTQGSSSLTRGIDSRTQACGGVAPLPHSQPSRRHPDLGTPTRAVHPVQALASGTRGPQNAKVGKVGKPLDLDVTFDMRSDTPKGKDPDSHSPTLREYHRPLWFPSNQVAVMQVINQRRGTHPKISDRLGPTLKCIRRHDLDEHSPLGQGPMRRRTPRRADGSWTFAAQ